MEAPRSIRAGSESQNLVGDYSEHLVNRMNEIGSYLLDTRTKANLHDVRGEQFESRQCRVEAHKRGIVFESENYNRLLFPKSGVEQLEAVTE